MGGSLSGFEFPKEDFYTGAPVHCRDCAYWDLIPLSRRSVTEVDVAASFAPERRQERFAHIERLFEGRVDFAVGRSSCL